MMNGTSLYERYERIGNLIYRAGTRGARVPFCDDLLAEFAQVQDEMNNVMERFGRPNLIRVDAPEPIYKAGMMEGLFREAAAERGDLPF